MKTKGLLLLLFLLLNIFSYADGIEIPVKDAAAPNMSPVGENQDKAWIISSDDQVISKTIEKWVNQEGYTLIWDSKVDFQIQTPGVIHDSLEQAIAKLLKSFNNNAYYLQISWYKEKSLVVVKQVNIIKKLQNFSKIQTPRLLKPNLIVKSSIKPMNKIDINYISESKLSVVKLPKLVQLNTPKKEISLVKMVIKSKDKSYSIQESELKPLAFKVKKSGQKNIVKKEAVVTKNTVLNTKSSPKEMLIFNSVSESKPLAFKAIKSKQISISNNEAYYSLKKLSMQSFFQQKVLKNSYSKVEIKPKLLTLISMESEMSVVKPLQKFKKIEFAPAIVPQEKFQVWIIDLDDKVISTTLNKWATKEGYILIWDSKSDFQIQTPGIIKGTFKNAINEVLKSFKDTDNPLRANWYKNKVIKITSAGNISPQDANYK